MGPRRALPLPAGMAIYTALGVALARLLWTRGAWRIVALALALTVTEWLRGHLFSGFPWNTFGYVLTGNMTLFDQLYMRPRLSDTVTGPA